MIIRLLLAFAILWVLYWLFKRWRTLPPEKRKSSLLTALIYGAAAVCVIAVLTGRLHWLGAVLAGAVALAKIGLGTALRLLPFFNVLRRTPLFNNPVFKTSYLEVGLNLQTGEISGQVLKGPHQGVRLEQLSLEQLKELEGYYQSRDKSSYFLVRVITQRAGRAERQESNFSSVADPSVDEALQILGLGDKPSKEDIIKAHRSLMQKLHPDRGGNDYLASRVNLAKEILLKHLNKTS